MDPRSWPLSASATRRLLDLRAERSSKTERKLLIGLAVKELLLRGALQIDETLAAKRKTTLIVTSRQPSHPLPPTAALLAARLGTLHRVDLAARLKSLFRKETNLPRALEQAAEQELLDRGLAERQPRKVLGVFTRRLLVLTASGETWQRHAQQLEARGAELARRPGEIDADAVDALGPTLLLAPSGLNLGARAAAKRRAAASSRTAAGRQSDDGSAGVIALAAISSDDLHAGNQAAPSDLTGTTDDLFSALDGLGDSLGNLLDDAISGLDSALDAGLSGLDSALESIDSAISSVDSAIDAGVSDAGGGADGGGGDGGGT